MSAEPAPHFALGALHKRLGRVDDAVRHFQRRLELNPDDPDGAKLFLAALGLGGRFAHHPDDVRSAADQCGFEVVSLEEAVVRREDDQPVHGLAVLLQARED
jgi:predicted TPR repeat methyltransferase